VLDAIAHSRPGWSADARAYRGRCAAAQVEHAVLTALLADRSAWRVVEAEPARRSRTHAEAGRGMAGGMIAPAYGRTCPKTSC